MMWLCSLQEAYFRYMAENPTAGLTLEEEDENIDYDSDGNPIPSTTKKIIMPLPPVDHSEVQCLTLIEHRQFKECFFNYGPKFYAFKHVLYL